MVALVATFALALLCDRVFAFVAPACARIMCSASSSSVGASISNGGVSTESEAKQQYPALPTSVKGILFDMDGTLTDSDTLHFEAYRETLMKVRSYSYHAGVKSRRADIQTLKNVQIRLLSTINFYHSSRLPQQRTIFVPDFDDSSVL